MEREFKEAAVVWLGFFLSLSTLLCCTLPILLIVLGMGSLMAAIVVEASWLTALLKYKFLLFLSSGLLLLAADLWLRLPGRVCPTDPELARRCQMLARWNQRLLRVSLIIWGIGFISAYLAIPISIWLGFF